MDAIQKASFIVYHLGTLEEDKLLQTIQSYEQQLKVSMNYEIEVIVILDGMPLAHFNKLKAKQDYDLEHLKILETPEFKGPGWAWNRGLELATGEVVAFVRTEAPWYEGSLFHFARLMIRESADIVYGPVIYPSGPYEDKNLDYMMIKKEIALKTGGFSEELTAIPIVDWLFIKALTKIASFEFLKGKTIVYLTHISQLSYPVTIDTRNNKIRDYTLAEEKSNRGLILQEESIRVETSFIVYHHKNMDLDDLLMSIESYRNQKNLAPHIRIEIIIMLDGIKTSDIPVLSEIVVPITPYLTVIESDEDFVGPGKLWNKGLEVAEGEWVVFTWTGAMWYDASVYYLKKYAMATRVGAYGLAEYVQINPHTSFIPKTIGYKEIAPQIISYVNSIALCYTLLKKQVVMNIGGFNPNREYARIADWEFLIRLTKEYKLEALAGKRAFIKKPLSDTDWQYKFKIGLDEGIRTLIFRSLPSCTYRIAVIAGVNESVQAKMAMISFLELYRDRGRFTWRRFPENEIVPEELEGYDLVFIVRGKTQAAVEAVKYCIENHIKTVYLMDDNWFHAVETYPQLESQIGKNTVTFSVFQLLISMVDHLWVYNDLIAEDLKSYAASIIKAPLAVNLKHFMKTVPRADQKIHIGFAGSGSKIQHFGAAFKALERIMDEFENVHLYFKGIELPSSFSKYEGRLVQETYNVDYEAYARTASNWYYDIMISPLDDTRYINSKCINKFLEITALGAVGIYTDIPLYQKVIRKGENGLLVENQENAWYESLKQLITHPEECEKMKQEAKKEIEANYELRAVLPKFLKEIEAILAEGREMW